MLSDNKRLRVTLRKWKVISGREGVPVFDIPENIIRVLWYEKDLVQQNYLFVKLTVFVINSTPEKCLKLYLL